VIFVLSSLALGADCASSCARMLGCLEVSEPGELRSCVQSCAAVGGPDPAVAQLIEQSSCEVVRQIFQQAAPASAPSAAARCPDPSAQADRRLYDTLVANRWCGFTFSGGTTTHTYLRLDPSGLATQSTNAETVRTGSNVDQYGDVTQTYGASSSEDGTQRGCWRLVGTQAQVSGDAQSWQPVSLSVTPNSNGAPILVIDGAEYMRCQ
jgi:hypothetical protein